MKLAELRKKLEGLKAKGLAILDKAETEGRNLSAEESDQYDQVAEEIAAVQSDIGEAEKMAERRRNMDAIKGSSALGTTVRDPNPATTHGFKDMAEFATAVRAASQRGGGHVDSRLMGAPTNVHQGGASSGEGYEVPPAWPARPPTPAA